MQRLDFGKLGPTPPAFTCCPDARSPTRAGNLPNIARLRHGAFEHVTLGINNAPEEGRHAFDRPEDLVEMPALAPDRAHYVEPAPRRHQGDLERTTLWGGNQHESAV